MTHGIALFGGTFDPVHHDHLRIARACADQLCLQNIIFLPAGQPYHKAQPHTADHHRLAMLEIAIADEPRFAVSDVDMLRQGNTYTYDTIQIFRQAFPNEKLYYLMGSDSLLTLHTWHRWRDWTRQVRLVVAMRDGSSLAQTPAALRDWLGQAIADGDVILLNETARNINSSAIRQALWQGQNSADIPDVVADYIHRHRLYRE